MITGVLGILAGLYAVFFSKSISERARREKWPAGGNRLFVVVVGVIFITFAALLLQSNIERSLESDGADPVSGWRWFWFIGGVLIFSGGLFAIAKSRSLAEKSAERRKIMPSVMPFLTPTSRRGYVIMGLINLALGLWWILGSWPF